MRRPEGVWRRQQPLANALEGALKSALDKKDKQLVTLATNWPLIAGSEIARFSYPKAIRGYKGQGTLILAVESGYATFLQHELPALSERIAQFLGTSRITRIKLESC